MTDVAVPPDLTGSAPMTRQDHVQLGHGSGGNLGAALLREHFQPHFAGGDLGILEDGAVVGMDGEKLVVSTDTFVVSPLEFPGGNIGSLAVHGTLNNVAMMGGRPRYLAAGFVLEEGLPFDLLDRVVAAMAEAAREADVELITGDTKVVEHGKADGMFITTTGIGVRLPFFAPHPSRVQPGDAVIVSGPIGRHGLAVMSAREALGSGVEVRSDSIGLFPLVDRLRAALEGEVHALHDPTRGGLGGALNAIAAASGVGVEIEEAALPVSASVAAICDELGLDPLAIANEGIFVAFVPPALEDDALDALRLHPMGRAARLIGHVVAAHPGVVLMRTAAGGIRVVDSAPGDQQARVC